jgi:hypothetical protein
VVNKFVEKGEKGLSRHEVARCEVERNAHQRNFAGAKLTRGKEDVTIV